MSTAERQTTPRYKVLVNNGSCHGGSFDWTPFLPTDDAPGPWTPLVERVRVCHAGYHLTTDPMHWPKVGMTVYAAEGRGAAEADGDKTAYSSVRLLRPAPAPLPAYWRAVEAFVATIPDTPWFQPMSAPDPAWRVFDTRAAARAAAGGGAGDAPWDGGWAAARAAARATAGSARTAARAAVGADAWDAAAAAAGDAVRDAAWGATGGGAWDAAWAAGLMAHVIVCDGRPLGQHHTSHARARWAVWQRGYGCLRYVHETLYVYRRPA